MSLRGKVSVWESLVNIAHSIVHGDINTSVITDGGSIDSFAKVIETLRARNAAEADGILRRSEENALAAESSRRAAEAARNEAAISAHIYESPAAGVNVDSGVGHGKFFNVRPSTAAAFVDEYQNVNGAAVPTGKSYPSADGLDKTFLQMATSITKIATVVISNNAFS